MLDGRIAPLFSNSERQILNAIVENSVAALRFLTAKVERILNFDGAQGARRGVAA